MRHPLSCDILSTIFDIFHRPLGWSVLQLLCRQIGYWNIWKETKQNIRYDAQCTLSAFIAPATNFRLLGGLRVWCWLRRPPSSPLTTSFIDTKTATTATTARNIKWLSNKRRRSANSSSSRKGPCRKQNHHGKRSHVVQFLQRQGDTHTRHQINGPHFCSLKFRIAYFFAWSLLCRYANQLYN